MADDSSVPNLDGLVDALVEGLFNPAKLQRLQAVMRNAHAEGSTIAAGLAWKVFDSIVETLGTIFFKVEEHLESTAGPPLSRIVAHLLGVDVSVHELRESATQAGDSRIGRAVADLAFRALGGADGELTPGSEGARKFLTLVSQLVISGWFEGTAFEMLTTLVPDMDAFESVSELPERLVSALGLGRLGRVALRPLAQTLVATPLTWQLNKKHTPSLLSESAALRAFIADDWSADQAYEELARQGWSHDRITQQLNQLYKRLSLEDMMVLERHAKFPRADTLANLQRDGYSTETAQLAVITAQTKRLRALDDNLLPALLTAYVDREITDGQFKTLFPEDVFTADERSNYERDARTRRYLNVRHLSAGEVLECVELEILPVAFYRAWLQREGYPEDEAFALELRLRARIDKATTIEQHRAAIEAERAAEKAKADAEKADRIAKAEADRALARRGSLAELRRAVVRGLIPLSRLEELLNAQYDPDFVATFLDLAEADRVEYVRQQDARAEAEKRALIKHIDVGALEQAVLENVLDFGRFRSALRDRGIVDDDADILTATLRARKADLDAARKQRADAEAALRNKQIDLGRFETLVRRGHRSLADYDQLLTSIGFSEPARAAMIDLLQLEIADDAKAAKAKDDAAAQLRNKGVSLETERRAVILELTNVDAYSRFLFDQGFNADAVALMIADVQRAIDEAQAARARRDQPPPPTPPRAIPLADVRRAARTGVILPDTYQARLQADGYSADDIAIEMELLLQEIADVQAARQKETQADQAAPAGLSLTQLAAAVRAGVKHLEDYRAAALANPKLSAGDVTTLVRVLADELAGSNVARARRTAIASTVKPQDVSIGDLEARVRAGTLAMQEYVSLLEGAGLDDVDIDLLTALLVDELTATPPA